MEAAFGSVDACKKTLAESAITQFASGWAWLVFDGDNLKVMKTGNANDPLADGLTPLLTIDVWEHAYYLDFRNLRPDFVDNFLNKLANYEYAQSQLNKS